MTSLFLLLLILGREILTINGISFEFQYFMSFIHSKCTNIYIELYAIEIEKFLFVFTFNEFEFCLFHKKPFNIVKIFILYNPGFLLIY